MRKIEFLIMLLCLLTGKCLHGQAVTTSPVMVTRSSSGVEITFHADGGNRGLIGQPASSPVYVHTGVITDLSANLSEWKHATKWLDNNDKYKMTYAGADTWTLTIPSIKSFYGVPESETVKKLVFVFRNADGSREGKTATGGDIVVDVFPDGFPSSKASSYPGGVPVMGAVTNSDGSVTFCLGAPSKTNVVLFGSWNDYATVPSQVMDYQDYNGFRYFWTTVKGLERDKDYIYYYVVDGSVQTGDPYANLVLDPWNDKYISPEVYPGLPSYPVHAVDDICVAVYNSGMNEYSWKVTDFKGVPQNDLIIYELLIRDFTGTEGKAYADGTVEGVIGKLDYIKELGVNAIELLPIMEFSGNNSWGYNPNFYMAPDKAYGTPDSYKALIDGAHERGMAVILDIVFNQSDGLHPWYDMYTRSNSPFYNGSAPHSYSVLNDWNQDCAMVQQQWYDVMDYWMNEYKVDGFRFDLVKGLGDNSSYGTPYNAADNTYGIPSEADTNRFNASRVARMKKLRDHMIKTNPDAYFINEDLAGAQEENDMARDGEINWANVNYASAQYVMGYSDGASLSRFYAPQDDNRLWGSTVSYAESHDEERVFYKARTNGDKAVRGSLATICKRCGSLAAQMLLTPGAHMIWQFEEIGDDQTTKKADGSNNTDPKIVRWSRLNDSNRKGLHDTYADLCAIRSANADLFAEGVDTYVDLSGWNARYISLAGNGKELYLIVNPAVSGTAVIPYPKHPSNGNTVNLQGAQYELLAVSYGTTPTLSTTGVSLPGGTFAVYGAATSSGVGNVVDEGHRPKPEVTVENGRIVCHTPYTSMTVCNIGGIGVDSGSILPSGIYIVTVDGTSVKIAVR